MWSMSIYLVIHFANEEITSTTQTLYELDITEWTQQGDMKTDTLSCFMNLFFFMIYEIMKLTVLCLDLENHSYITVKLC